MSAPTSDLKAATVDGGRNKEQDEVARLSSHAYQLTSTCCLNLAIDRT